MREDKIKVILNKRFKTPYINNLPNILFNLNKYFPNQIKGIIDQRYKHNELISYILNQACNHHDSLPLAEETVQEYVIKYFKNNRRLWWK